MIRRLSTSGRYGLVVVGLAVCFIGVVLAQSIRVKRIGPKQPETPAVSLSPASMNFGIQAVGTSSPQRTITLTNTGTGPLTISGINIVGGNSGDFSLGQNCPATLTAGANCTLSPTFTPMAAGPRKTLISISDDAGSGTQTVVLTGVGTAVSLSSASLTFGSSPQSVTVTNKGSSTLNLWQIAIVGANAGSFSETTTCGSTLAAGANCKLSVTFMPTTVGMLGASLLFSDDGGGSPQAVGLTGTVQFMVLDPTKTYLLNPSTGKPVFVLGDSAYDLAINLSADSDIDLYLSTRQVQGFNALWVATTDIRYSINGNDNALGQAPFTSMSTPFTGENEAYWEHLDYVLQRAAAYGFTVWLTPAQVGSGHSYCVGWCSYLESASATILTAYGEYLGNRYKNYPNIVWLLGGDLDLVDYPQLQGKVEAILTGIQSTDLNHMITEANEPTTTGYNSQDYNGGSAWPAGAWALNSFYHDYSGATGGGTMNGDANASWTRSDHLPTLSQQDAYDGGSAPSELILRTEAYQAVLGGTTLGDFYGDCTMWGFGYNDSCSDYVNSSTWKTLFNNTGATGRIWLANLMRSREFWKMVPDYGNTVVTAGYGSGDTTTTTARSSDGQTIISYVPNGNATTITVNMDMITSATSTVNEWWFDPSTGATTHIGTASNSGSANFTPPDSNDWVLVLDDNGANLPPPGSAGL